jgi:hypothetical protein
VAFLEANAFCAALGAGLTAALATLGFVFDLRPTFESGQANTFALNTKPAATKMIFFITSSVTGLYSEGHAKAGLPK